MAVKAYVARAIDACGKKRFCFMDSAYIVSYSQRFGLAEACSDTDEAVSQAMTRIWRNEMSDRMCSMDLVEIESEDPFRSDNENAERVANAFGIGVVWRSGH